VLDDDDDDDDDLAHLRADWDGTKAKASAMNREEEEEGSATTQAIAHVAAAAAAVTDVFLGATDLISRFPNIDSKYRFRELNTLALLYYFGEKQLFIASNVHQHNGVLIVFSAIVS